MGVKETFLELKQAWINSRGEEREKAERAMDAFWNSLSEDDNAELQKAIADDFERLHREVADIKETIIRNQMKEVLPAISVSYLAKHYFGKSTSWFYQRLNGNEVHGKVVRFTQEELEILNNALKDIGSRISSLHLSY
ncbi:MAG: DUF5053 domain-containing protein [Porphyromonadaceae bacterium]|nr:DUF5053 domain-containing protein [Porphyromonadaceae bacterium]